MPNYVMTDQQHAVYNALSVLLRCPEFKQELEDNGMQTAYDHMYLMQGNWEYLKKREYGTNAKT